MDAMNTTNLLGKRVFHNQRRAYGVITAISSTSVSVEFRDGTMKFAFPGAFANSLQLEDEKIQQDIIGLGEEKDFINFKRTYGLALDEEILFLKRTGGKKYQAVGGTLLEDYRSSALYMFETDSELHFPDGTPIHIHIKETRIPAYIHSCGEFLITIRVQEKLPDWMTDIEFTAEPWQLLVKLKDRLEETTADVQSIAYQVACKGRFLKDERSGIDIGQSNAVTHVMENPVTFIWGPPGTGKTETLSKIAREFINGGKRVLMLSYSNVSVDGALLRVAGNTDFEPGMVIRYGYPRMKELAENPELNSFHFVLSHNQTLSDQYKVLMKEKRTNKDPIENQKIRSALSRIRQQLMLEEEELVQKAAFVATTVTKAVVDPVIYSQQFDLVIFDEASMAYIPQVVYAASLAQKAFCCLGDFMQLPAIVQNRSNSLLKRDIFEHTGITAAVEEEVNHKWLVMLNRQYRMHPDIAEYVGKYMYHSLLSSGAIPEERLAAVKFSPDEEQPMCLMDLSGYYSACVETSDNSRMNLLSAMISVYMAEKRAASVDVGIIAPYSAQARLMMAMVRDLKKKEEDHTITCATVHQFQGSEKSMIIYDATDCYIMKHPGLLLSSLENNTADKLFNVALTRTQGKFILIANRDYFIRKKTSPKLLFRKTLDYLNTETTSINGVDIAKEITTKNESRFIFGNAIETWDDYITDIKKAKEEILIALSGLILDDKKKIDELAVALEYKNQDAVDVNIHAQENLTVPECIKKYVTTRHYYCLPVTVIDKEIIWYGQPLSDADFISSGDIIPTEYSIAARFAGRATGRKIAHYLEFHR